MSEHIGPSWTMIEVIDEQTAMIYDRLVLRQDAVDDFALALKPGHYSVIVCNQYRENIFEKRLNVP